MPEKPHNFWEELKCRKVIRVITVYAAAAFVIIELTNNITEPLRLPEWVPTLVIVLLAIGFLISIVMSWVYDITPEGVKKTKLISTEKEQKKEKPSSTLGWKIATYTSLVVIIGLLVINIFGREKKLDALEKSIAVLPFENLSSEEENAWFSDGITDVIINQLSKISSFRVIGRTSTLKYKEEKKSVPEIGEELGVNYIVEGTVQRQENKMRISVQLVRVLNEDHIWSDLYDRELNDIFIVQTNIAKRIAEELKTKLTPEEKEHISETATENSEAYNLYLQGCFHLQKRTKEGFIKSIEYFEKAVALDQDYALGYAGLADSYYLLAYWNYMSKPEAYTRSKEYITRALEIDINLAEAHTILGAILKYKEWNWEDARKEFELAIELNPNFVTAHQYYSDLLDILRENAGAREQINIALRMDPYFATLHNVSGLYYFHEGKYRESLNEYKIAGEINPRGINWMYFNNYLMLGEDIKALEAIKRWLQEGDSINVRYYNILKNESDKLDLNRTIELLIKMDLERVPPDPRNLAYWYSMIGDIEETLNWLELAFEDPPTDIPRVNNDPRFEFLRSEPRFQEMIRKMGLTAYQTSK